VAVWHSVFLTAYVTFRRTAPRRFKGHVCGQENGAGDCLGTRLGRSSRSIPRVAARGTGIRQSDRSRRRTRSVL